MAALRYHPDVRTNSSSSLEERQKSNDDFARINAAYLLLTRKKVYRIRKQSVTVTGPASESGASSSWTQPKTQNSENYNSGTSTSKNNAKPRGVKQYVKDYSKYVGPRTITFSDNTAATTSFSSNQNIKSAPFSEPNVSTNIRTDTYSHQTYGYATRPKQRKTSNQNKKKSPFSEPNVRSSAYSQPVYGKNMNSNTSSNNNMDTSSHTYPPYAVYDNTKAKATPQTKSDKEATVATSNINPPYAVYDNTRAKATSQTRPTTKANKKATVDTSNINPPYAVYDNTSAKATPQTQSTTKADKKATVDNSNINPPYTVFDNTRAKATHQTQSTTKSDKEARVVSSNINPPYTVYDNTRAKAASQTQFTTKSDKEARVATSNSSSGRGIGNNYQSNSYKTVHTRVSRENAQHNSIRKNPTRKDGIVDRDDLKGAGQASLNSRIDTTSLIGMDTIFGGSKRKTKASTMSSSKTKSSPKSQQQSPNVRTSSIGEGKLPFYAQIRQPQSKQQPVKSMNGNGTHQAMSPKSKKSSPQTELQERMKRGDFFNSKNFHKKWNSFNDAKDRGSNDTEALETEIESTIFKSTPEPPSKAKSISTGTSSYASSKSKNSGFGGFTNPYQQAQNKQASGNTSKKKFNAEERRMKGDFFDADSFHDRWNPHNCQENQKESAS